ncbi:hypothetical protein BDFB_013781, partial [Asbolus verrucosus]
MVTKVSENANNFPQWKVEQGLLYKLIPSQSPLPSNSREWKVVVPKSQCVEVIRSNHDSPLSSHFERTNLTVGTVTRCYIKSHREWDRELAKIQQAINTARHEVTGDTSQSAT